ncbi:hypothetical protein BVG81_003530 [Haliangium sp. UPWRP_2]|nr:hypothetical protein BVG81_003530 [Haliangium sp. UPWRP_2]
MSTIQSEDPDHDLIVAFLGLFVIGSIIRFVARVPVQHPRLAATRDGERPENNVFANRVLGEQLLFEPTPPAERIGQIFWLFTLRLHDKQNTADGLDLLF